MEIHHDRHHAGYTKNLNAAIEKHSDWQDRSISEILRSIDKVPEDIRTAVRNNGGGYANHGLFWKIMSPNGGGDPGGQLGDAIRSKSARSADLKDTLTNTATAQFGSGWGWLVLANIGDQATSS